MYNSKQHSWSI